MLAQAKLPAQKNSRIADGLIIRKKALPKLTKISHQRIVCGSIEIIIETGEIDVYELNRCEKIRDDQPIRYSN